MPSDDPFYEDAPASPTPEPATRLRASPPTYERHAPEEVPDLDPEPEMEMEPEREYVAPPVAPFPVAVNAGRTLPHSIEAEEYVLSSCLMDWADVLPHCEESRITPESFYEPKNAIVYDHLLRLHNAGKPISIDVLAEEMRATKQLAKVGGFPFLMQITSRIPTTGQAVYFIKKVSEQATLREVIRSATMAVERAYNFSGNIEEFTEEAETAMQSACRARDAAPTWNYVPFSDFAIPEANDNNALLGKHRFLCRGGAVVIVGPSGIGKSSVDFQSAVCWALGRDFLGITCTRPLKQIIIQAEDDPGDIGEVWASIAAGMELTKADIARVRRNVLIVEERVEAGEGFLRKLGRAVRSVKKSEAPWDLVRINPFLAFAGCSVADQEEMGRFLRSGLNRVNQDKSFAYIITHHTNKPAAPSNGKPQQRNWNEFLYAMSGSAELPNWARGVITLEPQKEEGKFIIRLAKRGTRAGITREVEQGAGYRTEVVTKIFAKHSSKQLDLPNGRKMPMICWEADLEAAKADLPEAQSEPSNENEAKATAVRTRRSSKYSMAEVLELFRVGGEDKADPLQVIIKKAAADLAMPKNTLLDYRKELLEKGLIAKTDMGLYYRVQASV